MAGFVRRTPLIVKLGVPVSYQVVLWQRDNWGPFFGFTRSATIVGQITQAEVASLGITSGSYSLPVIHGRPRGALPFCASGQV
jgi:hypothetical protein